MKSLSTDHLADLVDKRHRCLTQLRDLGHKQSELISAGEMTALLRLISTKNQLIGALQSIEHGLQPFHAQDPEQRAWPTAEARARCAQQAESCQKLLQEVMELERQNEQSIIARRDDVAAQLQAAQAAGAARGAYQAQQLSSLQGPHQSQNAPVAPLTNDSACQRLDLHSNA